MVACASTARQGSRETGSAPSPLGAAAETPQTGNSRELARL